jgi:hypothetical protein
VKRKVPNGSFKTRQIETWAVLAALQRMEMQQGLGLLHIFGDPSHRPA